MTAPPLVIGYPRTGFTLLISAIAEIRQAAGLKPPGRSLLQVFCDGAGARLAAQICAVFARRGIGQDLLYNGNFRLLTGGPKWLKAGDSATACFRKYIGVRGLGDFTLITAHPRAVLQDDDILHSHVSPAGWLAHPGYAEFQKFSSLRHPAGTLASACFSLNALASEYIQKFIAPDQDNDALRQELALYKLSDRNFFAALLGPYKAYLEEYAAVAERYIPMRWEALISAPVPTLQHLASSMDIDLPEAEAEVIWRKLDHVNLTGAHQHNLRRGHGVVGGWRRWLTNEHLEMMREAGLFGISAMWGDAAPAPLDAGTYTPFQQRLAEALAQGRVIRAYRDEDLFGFAFNKSNLDLDRFAFKRYGWRGHTQIERSTCTDDGLVMAVWDAAEAGCAAVNRALSYWDWQGSERVALAMADEVAGLFEDEAAWRDWRASLLAACQASPHAPPRLLQAVGEVNVVFFAGRYYGLPQSLGPVDLQNQPVEALPGIVIGHRLDSVLAALKDRAA